MERVGLLKGITLATWAAVGVVALGGCGEATIKTATDTAVEPGSEARAPDPGQSASSARLGGSITLRGNDDGTLVQITALDVQDPVRSGNSYIQPDPGNRYVGVRIRVRNVGAAPYNDAPSNGASIVDGDDQEHSASIFDVVEPGLGSLKVRPGDQRVGWITFEVPRGAALRLFQFTLDSGFGPETGEWRLR